MCSYKKWSVYDGYLTLIVGLILRYSKGTASSVELSIFFIHRIFQLYIPLLLQDVVPVEHISIPLSPLLTLEGGGVQCVSE